MKVQNMMKRKNESRALIKHISRKFRCDFDGGKYNSKRNWNSYKCQCLCKNK